MHYPVHLLWFYWCWLPSTNMGWNTSSKNTTWLNDSLEGKAAARKITVESDKVAAQTKLPTLPVPLLNELFFVPPILLSIWNQSTPLQSTYCNTTTVRPDSKTQLTLVYLASLVVLQLVHSFIQFNWIKMYYSNITLLDSLWTSKQAALNLWQLMIVINMSKLPNTNFNCYLPNCQLDIVFMLYLDSMVCVSICNLLSI